MSLPKSIHIKESIKELRSLQKNSIPTVAHRIRILIALKEHESTGISKRQAAELVGVNHDMVQKWRSIYASGGLAAVLHYKKAEGHRARSVFSEEEHHQIEAKLHDPRNGLQGYVELQKWVKSHLGKEVHYSTLLNYVKRHFGATIKVARKSHVKKDEEAVTSFKKSLEASAGK
jgi:transposase